MSLLDLAKTMLQEHGACNASRLTVREVVEIVTDLGIDPNDVRLMPVATGVQLQVRRPIEQLARTAS